MAPIELTTDFGCAPAPALGHSDEHSVLTHMPGYQNLLDFGARNGKLNGRFKNTYPRFGPAAKLVELGDYIIAKSGLEGYQCLLFLSRRAAEECVKFATSSWFKENAYTPKEIHLKCFQLKERIYAVFVVAGPKFRAAAIPFWLDCGPIMSARQAVANLAFVDTMQEISLHTPTEQHNEEHPVHDQLRQRIVSLLERQIVGAPRTPVSKGDVYLFQTGMAAIYYMSQWLPKWKTGTTVLLGYSFSSTIQLMEKYYNRPFKFFELGDKYHEVEEYIRKETEQGRPIQALFCEFPSNPMLLTPDLMRLREIADKYDTMLVVDDTISSFSNVDVLGKEGADISWSSLTKSFNGYSDCMGGSVVLNPCSKYYEELKALYAKEYQNDLYVDDALVLEANSRDYLSRSIVLNRNGLALAFYLQSCVESSSSTVSKVWYPPLLPSRSLYSARMRPANNEFTPGYGCLMTFELETMEAFIAFYEEIGKYITISPHLAGHITLVMPYVMALYAQDLTKVACGGLNARQLRVSVGLEDTDLILAAFRHALTSADATKVNSSVNGDSIVSFLHKCDRSTSSTNRTFVSTAILHRCRH